jgi:hypothetical protein
MIHNLHELEDLRYVHLGPPTVVFCRRCKLTRLLLRLAHYAIYLILAVPSGSTRTYYDAFWPS